MQLGLREQYPEFIFESYNIDYGVTGIHVQYTYRLANYVFTPKVTIPADSIKNQHFDRAFLDTLFFHFGIINAINYYKLSCPPTFIIKAAPLDPVQAAFYKKLFYHGLGEFMYINNLDLKRESFLNIVADPPSTPPTAFDLQDDFHGNLIPVGGGKDSIVTLRALDSMHDDNLCLQYNRSLYPTNHAAISAIKATGYSLNQIVNFNLEIDPLLLELNHQGFYNGHVPFSASLAFACIIMAHLNNKAYAVLSNESSADEGNLKGSDINHQYSKSLEFETDFRNFTSAYFTNKIQYFSLLRCLNEYEIVQKFLKFPTYLDIFRSCNVGTRTNSWCGHCAKCLYVYIMLYPFVSQNHLQRIFGHDLFSDETLLNDFIGLVNPDKLKPFECVGTKEEINYSLRLAINQTDNRNLLPPLLKYYTQNYYQPTRAASPFADPEADRAITDFYNPNHYIPESYLKLILSL
ncbi:hypothetical protein IKF15_04170 [Candidatus Saccharibacteria bacterium]|nr:hypothetical protein [Candidatus Saccharibacteria bacterium]